MFITFLCKNRFFCVCKGKSYRTWGRGKTEIYIQYAVLPPKCSQWPGMALMYFFFFMWMPGAQALVPPSSEVLGALARKCI